MYEKDFLMIFLIFKKVFQSNKEKISCFLDISNLEKNTKRLGSFKPFKYTKLEFTRFFKQLSFKINRI